MTKLSDYQSLIRLERDIDNMIKTQPAQSFFHQKEIKAFYEKNGPRLKAARLNLNEMMKEHVVFKDNQFLTTTNGDDVKEYLFKTPADKEEYSAKFEALMQFQIEVYS